jgi:hypothetical protein
MMGWEGGGGSRGIDGGHFGESIVHRLLNRRPVSFDKGKKSARLKEQKIVRLKSCLGSLSHIFYCFGCLFPRVQCSICKPA